MASDFAQTVKQQADIVKIIGDYVRLKKSGAQNYSGLCPFHSEKSPHFPSTRRASSTTASAAGSRAMSSALYRRSKTSAFLKPSARSRRSAGFALPKRDFNSPEEAQESRQRGKLLDLHEAATVWFQDQLEFP